MYDKYLDMEIVGCMIENAADLLDEVPSIILEDRTIAVVAHPNGTYTKESFGIDVNTNVVSCSPDGALWGVARTIWPGLDFHDHTSRCVNTTSAIWHLDHHAPNGGFITWAKLHTEQEITAQMREVARLIFSNLN